MSDLTSFIATASTSAQAIIGAENVTIGSVNYPATLAEATFGREYDSPGFMPQNGLRAVFRAGVLPSDLLGRTATARGVVYRIANVSKGQAFTTLELVDKSSS